MSGPRDEAQLVELGLFVSTTFVAFVVLVILAVLFGVRTVEQNLESTATRLLAERGVENIEIVANGVDLSLRGTVTAEDQLTTIPEFVAGIEGVGSVSPELVYVPPLDIDVPDVVAAPLSLEWSGGDVVVTGELSDTAARDAVIADLEGVFPGSVAADGLLVKGDVPSERDWLPRMLTLVRIGGEALPEGRMFVSPGERLIQISGEVASRQERKDLRVKIDDVVSQTTFTFISGLSVPDTGEFTPQDVVELQESINDLIAGKVVEFELNSDVLTPVGTTLLDEILAALEKFPNVPIGIEGHTDSLGSAADNQDLSERRARAAFDYLVAHGQDPDRFVVVGYGESQPIADNATAAGRARNRRIEFKALEE